MKIRFKKTKGTKKEYNQFKKLFETLGIKVIPVADFEVNLNFEETNQNGKSRK